MKRPAPAARPAPGKGQEGRRTPGCTPAVSALAAAQPSSPSAPLRWLNAPAGLPLRKQEPTSPLYDPRAKSVRNRPTSDRPAWHPRRTEPAPHAVEKRARGVSDQAEHSGRGRAPQRFPRERGALTVSKIARARDSSDFNGLDLTEAPDEARRHSGGWRRRREPAANGPVFALF